MNTPIIDFLKDYSGSGTLRAHMPGHKGISPSENIPDALFIHDITEIPGADSLFEANGIIAESEKNMSRLYGTYATVYSAAGSTLCIQAMLYLMKCERRKVFAVRNVHRAFLNAAALTGIDTEWIMPDYSGGLLSGEINTKTVEEKLSRCSVPACLYVTSPDYTGKIADIRTLSEICRRYGARLIVDNAHGAHLAFLTPNIHPITLGADLCCDSAHKMLPALTGAAMLHSGRDFTAEQLKQAMSLFASTSPSYLILASLDLCTDYIDRFIKEDIRSNTNDILRLKEHFSDRLLFAESEPFHITVKASASGIDGIVLAENLRRNGVECEYTDCDITILLMSAMNCHDDYVQLTSALESAYEQCGRIPPYDEAFSLTLPPKAMGIRDAVFAPNETIPVESALGRICGAVKVPCPPAVPIAASGEIITAECINIFKKYRISEVNVVK
ncbi:MAG: aminotransferase class I/II-fold pyridoxal phosphate-dependent enzyme [Oscillospiraceae bacterium]|nr:aminotransferase class I/II-fold pyridoxal phosphate-dependent enzyme [Oscillospiraceae bacterium]